MQKVRIGLIGAGFTGRLHAKGYLETPNVELVAVAAKTRVSAEKFCKEYGMKAWYTDYMNLIKRKDIDAVSICLPNKFHAPATIAAAEAGKHVMCEKPMAITMEEADKMIKAADKAGVKLFIAETVRFVPSFVRVKELIEEGAIGKVFMFKAHSSHSGPHSLHFLDPEMAGGGVLIDLAIHYVDLFRWYTNKEVERVYAEMETFEKDTELEDNGIMFLRYKGGIGNITASWTTKGEISARVEVFGTEGSIFSSGHGHTFSPTFVFSDKGYGYVAEKTELSRGWTFPVHSKIEQLPYTEETKHFVKCILQDKKPLVDGEEGKKDLEVVLAAYESVRKEKPVKLTHR